MELGDFERWYSRERPRVYASVLVLCGDPDAARDATDEAFVRALERWRRVSQMASPGAWVQTVAMNQVRRVKRRRALELVRLRRRAAAPVEVSTGPDGWIWDVVRRLPHRQRVAVVLRFVADLPEAEIAQVMGISRGTVASTLAAARARLALELAAEPAAEDVDG